MKEYDKEKPLISIHVPKTGGTSLEQLLRNWFGTKLYLHYYDEKNNRPPETFPLGPGICIHGHFNKQRHFGIQDYYPGIDQMITFLRDPFEILVSRYFDVKEREKKGEAFRDGKPLRITDDLDEYLEKETREPAYHPNFLDYMPARMTAGNYKEIIHEYFVYIGVMENFQYSMERLAQRLNTTAVPPSHLNRSERSYTYSPRYKMRFMELHPLEYEIYYYVLTNHNKW